MAEKVLNGQKKTKKSMHFPLLFFKIDFSGQALHTAATGEGRENLAGACGELPTEAFPVFKLLVSDFGHVFSLMMLKGIYFSIQPLPNFRS